MLATLLRLVPDARRYFLSERWGGYGERGWRVDPIQNPVVMPALLIVWMGACIALAVGRFPTIGNQEYFGLTFEKGNSLAGCANKAIEALKQDGTIQQLEQQWITSKAHAPLITK
jgi:hypothetical protein